MDIIAGRMCPELGGQEDYLDILGFNYYWNCQWKACGEPLVWPDEHQQRLPLSTMLNKAYIRYQKPFFYQKQGISVVGVCSGWKKSLQSALFYKKLDCPF